MIYKIGQYSIIWIDETCNKCILDFMYYKTLFNKDSVRIRFNFSQLVLSKKFAFKCLSFI